MQILRNKILSTLGAEYCITRFVFAVSSDFERKRMEELPIEIFTIVSEHLEGCVWGKAEIKKEDRERERARALEMAEARKGREEAEISCKERKSELVRYLGKWLKGGERR